MSAEIADDLRALCMSDVERLSDHYRVNAFVRLGYAAADALDAKDKRIADLEAALSEIAAGPHLLSCDKAKWADWAADRAASSLPNKENRNG